MKAYNLANNVRHQIALVLRLRFHSFTALTIWLFKIMHFQMVEIPEERQTVKQRVKTKNQKNAQQFRDERQHDIFERINEFLEPDEWMHHIVHNLLNLNYTEIMLS